MSKIRDLEEIMNSAPDEQEHMLQADRACAWLEGERSVDYSTLTQAEAQAKADEIRAVATVIQFGYLAACSTILKAPKAVARSRGRQNASKARSKNPRLLAVNEAKARAHELWIERRRGQHPRLSRNEDFATEALHRFPALTSIGQVVKWCTQWEKDQRKEAASNR